MELKNNEFIYFGDPMCSWCYGFTQELEALMDHYKDKFSFRVIIGGLRPYTKEPLNASTREELRHHWDAVNERTGVPFNYDLLDNTKEFVYDTEKPCRAVVTARKIDPSIEFLFFKKAQESFYAIGHDTNNINTYLDIAESVGIPRGRFTEYYLSDDMRMETWQEFTWAKQVGISSLPSLALNHQEKFFAVSLGYSTFDIMKGTVEKILNDPLPE